MTFSRARIASADSVRSNPLSCPRTEPLTTRYAAFWADLRPGLVVKQQFPKLVTPTAGEQSPVKMDVPDTRTMKDTFIEFDLLFESDKSLVEIYAGAHTSIRLGRLMEGMPRALSEALRRG